MGRVSQFFGKRFVDAGWRREPGVSGFMKPSRMIMPTTTGSVSGKVWWGRGGEGRTGEAREYADDAAEG